MQVKTVEEITKEMHQKGIKEFSIIEGDSVYHVFTDKGVINYIKPMEHNEIVMRLSLTVPAGSMEAFLNITKNPIQNKAYKAVGFFLEKMQKEKKTCLLLCGSVGAGKTSNAIRVLYHLMKRRQITNPLYLSVITDIEDYKEKAKIIDSDAFLIDDLNLSAGDWKLQTAKNIMLYALERNHPLLITSNNTYQELPLEQHIRSRIESKGIVIHIKDKDYRIEK